MKIITWNCNMAFRKKAIHSVYHHHHKQKQGREEHPTFYLYRHQEKAYHIDYCFASADILEKVLTVEIGDHDFWTKYSDHTPMMVIINTDR